MKITSRDNSLLRHARAVRDGKVDELIYVEGLRLCVEALRSNLAIDAMIFSEQLASKDKASAAIDELAKAAQRVASVSEKLLESISYTKTPQGIVLLAQRPEASEERLSASLTKNPLIVVLHRINNPVNVGAILFHRSRCAARWARRFVYLFGEMQVSLKPLSGVVRRRSSLWEPMLTRIYSTPIGIGRARRRSYLVQNRPDSQTTN